MKSATVSRCLKRTLIPIPVLIWGLSVYDVVLPISMALIWRVPTMTTLFMSFTSSITFRWPITSGTAVGNVVIIQTGEWRFDDNARAAYLWKRWKLRGARVMFGMKVRSFTTASWSVPSKPLLVALYTLLSPYTSPRHNVLYVQSSFNLVSSGCFKCCNMKDKNIENSNTVLQWR
jgi:hypothetical protein